MRTISTILFFWCTIYTCSAQQTLLALSKKDHTLAVVDPVSLKVLYKVPVGIDPHEVIASTDGRTAYVSIYGGGGLHEIDVIDLVGHKASSPIDTKPFLGPHGLAFADGKLWFTAEGSKCVVRYDPATQAFDWVMGTGQDRTHMLYVASNVVYTTNVASGTVSVLAAMAPRGPGGPGRGPRLDWVQTLIRVSGGCEGFDVTPDGKQLWTASAEDGFIYVVDLENRKVVDKIDAHVEGANRVQFTPDGRRALITSLRNGDLVVYDVNTRKSVKRIPIGHGAAGILVSPDGARAFIGCTPDNYVAVIDLKTLSLNGRIDVGGGPDGLAWATRPIN